MSFKKILREDVIYDKIKSHKNQGFTLYLEDTLTNWLPRLAFYGLMAG